MDHPYRVLIIGGSGSGNPNVLLSLIKHQRSDLEKNCLYLKDPFRSQYQLLIKWREKVRIKKLKNLKAFIDYSQTIDEVYENLEAKRNMLIVFDGLIAHMEANRKLSPIGILKNHKT